MSIQYAGQYEVKELLVYTSSGAVLNLRNAIQSINIYESMFSTSLSGSITILDVDDIATIGPVIGQEYMKLRLTTPDLDEDEIDFTNTTFAIYKVDSRISGSQNAQLLTLSFTTPELLKNNRIRLSKSYTGTIDEIVKNVLTEESSINTIKDVYVEETSGIRKIIAPNINPFNFITTLATEALSAKYGSPHFFFFENTKGLHFKSMESILADDAIGFFTTSDLGPIDEIQKKPDVQVDFERVRDFQINTNNDMLMNISGGMLGSKDIEYNIYNKSYKTREYKYFDDFDNYPRLNENTVYNDNEIDVEGNTVGDFTNARIHLHSVSSEDGIDTQHTNDKAEYKYSPNRLNEAILQRQAKFMELNSGVGVSMEIAGNTIIAAGQKMRLVVPVTGRVHADELDPYYSGNYIITKLRHNFSQADKKHTIYLQASQESFEGSLPSIGDAKEPLGQRGAISTLTY